MTFAARSLISGNSVVTDRAASLPAYPTGIEMTLIDDGPAPYITLTFDTDGTWSCVSSQPSYAPTQSGTWLTGTGTSSDYYIKVNLTDDSFGLGSLTGSATSTWLSLASAQSWTITQSTVYDPQQPYGKIGIIFINFFPGDYYNLANGYVNLHVAKIPTFGGG